MFPNPELTSGKTTVVTVTYGNRGNYVERLVHACLQQENAGRVIVVKNGGQVRLDALVRNHPKRVEFLELSENLGSAGGYAAGIKKALELENPYIWLLDDDNVPLPGALIDLHQELLTRSREYGLEKTATLANRPGQLFLFAQRLSSGEPPDQIFPARSCFLGFHLWQWLKRKCSFPSPTPAKVFDRTPTGSHAVPFGPYGGFLAHRTVFQKMGFPREDFLIYADDTEYTYRLTSAGGRIFLCPKARVEDIETSWYAQPGVGNAVELRLKWGSDLQVYFSTRNQAFFDHHHWNNSQPIYAANRCAFLLGTALMAMKLGKRQRFKLLWKAVKEGESGLLGPRQEFPFS